MSIDDILIISHLISMFKSRRLPEVVMNLVQWKPLMDRKKLKTKTVNDHNNRLFYMVIWVMYSNYEM